MKSITPFLTFEGRAEEAMKYYEGDIQDARIRLIQRYDATDANLEGKVMQGP